MRAKDCAVGHTHGVVPSGAADCECHEQLHEELSYLGGTDRGRIVRRLLAAADEQRRRIEALLVLLGDFDPNEPGSLDDGVIAEAGLLFHDIAGAAEVGASLLGQARRLEFGLVGRGDSNSTAIGPASAGTAT
jgi:hypothetical protein